MEAGDTEAAADLADAEPRMPALLADTAERIIIPVTSLCGIGPDLCDHSFALEAVGFGQALEAHPAPTGARSVDPTTV
ncbi:hypothetical protein [Streptomyces eurythermus]|uniref:hypothetical protein n=1 Tax=Streptomyces eurythermus TaxID=42237 RepID=UPI0036FCE65F